MKDSLKIESHEEFLTPRRQKLMEDIAKLIVEYEEVTNKIVGNSILFDLPSKYSGWWEYQFRGDKFIIGRILTNE